MKKKKGLFLSIELIIIIILVIILIIATALGARFLMNQVKVMMLQKNVRMYQESVQKFYHLYQWLPGDMPENFLVGDLNAPVLKTSILNLRTKNTAGAADTATSIYQRSMGTGSLHSFKAPIAFVQLELAGMIPKGSVNTSSSLLGYAGFLNNPTGQIDTALYFPVAQDNSRFFLTNYSNDPSWQSNEATAGNILPEYTLFKRGNTAWATQFNNNQLGKAAIIISNAWFKSANDTANLINVTDVNDNATGINAEIMAQLDTKIDDGLPSGKNSKVIAEPMRVAGGWDCTNYTSLPNNTTLLAAKYTNSRALSSTEGCIPHFIFDY